MLAVRDHCTPTVRRYERGITVKVEKRSSLEWDPCYLK